MNIKIIIPFILLVAILLSSCKECKFESIKTNSLPNAEIGKTYETIIEYDCNCDITYRIATIESGALPDGLEMDVTGKITGTPTNPGTYNFNVSVKICFQMDGAMPFDCYFKEKSYTLIVL